MAARKQQPLTLDFARDAFVTKQTTKSALTYAEVAGQYHRDGMIEDATFKAILAEIYKFMKAVSQ